MKQYRYIVIIYWQRSHVFQWDGKSAGKWSKVDVKLELPKDTILEVEFVQELRGEVSLPWGDTFSKTLCIFSFYSVQ